MRKLIALAVAVSVALSGCATAAQFRTGAATMQPAEVCSGWQQSFERSDLELRALAWQEMQRRGLNQTDCKNILEQQSAQRAEALKIGVGILAAALAIAAVAQVAKNSGGGTNYAPTTPTYDSSWDWDEFYDTNGDLVWACRGVSTGRFAEAWRCAGLAQTDIRWPSKRAL